MKKLSIIALFSALMLCVCSCGDQPSKQFKEMEEEVLSIENQINAISDCDELQMMNIAILGLRSDMDNYRQESEMTDAEIGKLDDLVDQLEATWRGKWTTLNCEQGFSDEEFNTSGEEDDFDYNIL